MFDKKAYMEEYNKQYYIKNKERLKEYGKEYGRKYGKQYYIKNREKTLNHHKQYYIENRDNIILKQKQRRRDNPEYCLQYYIDNKKKIIKYYQEHKVEIKAYQRKYYLNNIKMIRKKKNVYCKDRTKTDLKSNLNHRMSIAILLSLKGNKNGRHWESLVGYTLDDLANRLKQTMPNGYTWQDYMEGKLEIDHRIPISVFNFTNHSHTDFKRCWALSNLRLLPAEENLIKSNKLTKPFQPALKI